MAVFGDFEWTEDDNLIGPGDYINEAAGRIKALVNNIFDGKDLIFNTMAIAHPERTYDIALLARIQNDYAEWKGMREFLDTVVIEEMPDAE